MNTRFLFSPAYLVSVTSLIAGAALVGTRLMMIGWILLIVGIALNAMSLVVLANREHLHRAQLIGTIPKTSTQKTGHNHGRKN